MKKLALIALLLSGCATNVTARPATKQELRNFFRASFKVCPDGTKVKSNKSCPIVTPTPTPTPTPVPTPTPPPTQVCWDGSIILLTAICPAVPPPVPPPPPPAPPVFSVGDVTVNEANSTATIPVTKIGANGSPSTLSYTTTSGTAMAGADFLTTHGTLTIPDGVTTTSISVPIIDDSVVEATETFNVTITPVTNATASKPVGIVTILDNDVAAPPPPPPPPASPTYVATTDLFGAPAVADNFDITTSYTTGFPIPPSGAPDVVGAFRFICAFDKLLPDDPVVYPGQPGKSHQHNFYGNEGVSAYATFNSLRTTSGSTCNHYGDGTTAANRSGYWIPAMDDGKGHYVQPDYASLYYKRRPASDPVVSVSTNAQYMGQAVPVPNGIRFIFGYNMGNPSAPVTGGPYFNCDGPTAIPAHYASINAVVAANACPAGNRLGFIIQGPACWDGQYLDTPDHRAHIAYATYGGWGYLKCDSAHPYVMPELTLATWWSVATGDDLSLWHFSSDEMHPELPHGATGHADYFEAWSNPIKMMWENNCINLMLNCNSGDLGNGIKLQGGGVPTYIIAGVPVTSWTNPNRLVNK